MVLFFYMEQLAITSADIAGLVYSMVFFGGVIGAWGFIQGVQQRF